MAITCTHVKICLRRVSRSRTFKRAVGSSRFIKKHLLRGATFGIFPSTLNDMAFHHAQFNMAELLHVTTDTATITGINTVASILMTAVKL
jgi:hypothetical protein